MIYIQHMCVDEMVNTIGSYYRILLLAALGIVAALSFAETARAQQVAEQLTISLAEQRVGITSGFDGSHLSLFGTKNAPGEIAVVVWGPRREMVVRHKSRVMGIWANTDSVRFRQVPSYYDLALSVSEHDIAAADVRREFELGLDTLDYKPAGRHDIATLSHFQSALVRNKQTQGYFPLAPQPVIFLNPDFFRADFQLPPNVPTGEYIVKAYLFRDGQLRAQQQTGFRIAQEGASASIYIFAHEQSLLYGLFVIFFAMFSGWGAWALLQRE